LTKYTTGTASSALAVKVKLLRHDDLLMEMMPCFACLKFLFGKYNIENAQAAGQGAIAQRQHNR
jgi:hypothetical protein